MRAPGLAGSCYGSRSPTRARALPGRAPGSRSPARSHEPRRSGRRSSAERPNLLEPSFQEAALAVVADELERSRQAALGRGEVAQASAEVGPGGVQQVVIVELARALEGL